MNEATDTELLRDYAERGNEAAFCELVARHTDFVYSSALRQVNSPDLAADVAQSVFADLARKAGSLAQSAQAGVSLAGWLYRGTRFAALNQLRDERRRRARERQAMEHFDPAPGSASEWERMRPVLDQAMSELGEADREALLLRFFKNYDLRAVGQALGASDDAAQKRVAARWKNCARFFPSGADHLGRRPFRGAFGQCGHPGAGGFGFPAVHHRAYRDRRFGFNRHIRNQDHCHDHTSKSHPRSGAQRGDWDGDLRRASGDAKAPTGPGLPTTAGVA